MRATQLRHALLAAAICSGLWVQGAGAQDGPEGKEAFRIGMVAPEGTPAVEGLSTIKDAYSRALGRPVEVIVARDYAALVDAHAAGRLDYAIYSSTAFATAALRCGCVRAIVSPIRRNGAIGMRSVLVARNGESTETPQRLAIGSNDSIAGRLAPLALYPKADDEGFRDTLVEVDSMSDAEARFLNGQVSGFFGWVLAWEETTGAPAGGTAARLRQAGLDADQYSIEWESPPIRFGPHAVRTDLDEESVERLRKLLTTNPDPALVASIDRLHGGGFVAADNAGYDVVLSILESVGR